MNQYSDVVIYIANKNSFNISCTPDSLPRKIVLIVISRGHEPQLIQEKSNNLVNNAKCSLPPRVHISRLMFLHTPPYNPAQRKTTETLAPPRH